uniref:Uncharacterized protein n=1 Tax=Anguilla anguilla TaxID=7936 RepID=A0A0E9RS83_ANGAN
MLRISSRPFASFLGQRHTAGQETAEQPIAPLLFLP